MSTRIETDIAAQVAAGIARLERSYIQGILFQNHAQIHILKDAIGCDELLWLEGYIEVRSPQEFQWQRVIRKYLLPIFGRRRLCLFGRQQCGRARRLIIRKQAREIRHIRRHRRLDLDSLGVEHHATAARQICRRAAKGEFVDLYLLKIPLHRRREIDRAKLGPRRPHKRLELLQGLPLAGKIQSVTLERLVGVNIQGDIAIRPNQIDRKILQRQTQIRQRPGHRDNPANRTEIGHRIAQHLANDIERLVCRR